jgi:hypothetical protein
MSRHLKQLLGESALWVGANALTTGVAILVAGALSPAACGGGPMCMSLFLLAAICSISWGSWISLTFAQSRGLRIGMKAVTLVPGLLLLGFGALGVYTRLGSMFFWIALVLSAVGTLATAVLLWREHPREAASLSTTRLANGFLVYPFLTVLASTAVVSLWWWYLSQPMEADWRNLFQISTVLITVLAIELCTTVVPAGISLLCSRVNRMREAS